MSTLINTARALDDTRFLWRVRAAILITARNKLASGTSNANIKAYANAVMADPMAQDRQMEALVAADDTVADLVVVDEFNTVSTEDVPDSVILTSVSNNWLTVANMRAAAAAA